MTEKQHVIPVWFFVGVMLLVYGLLILGSGIAEFPHPPATVLADLHPAIWWGALLAVLGAFYVIHYWPGRGNKGADN